MSDLICVTGANSAVGCALLRFAQETGQRVVACVRSERAAAELPGRDDLERVEILDYRETQRLEEALHGCQSVIHLPGVLVERPGSTYRDANLVPVEAVVRASQRANVRKLVLVSAIGADASSRNGYYASKGAAEAQVAAGGIAYTILRAPLILGEGTEGEAALRREISRAKPALLGGGRTRQQPLAVMDLARGALAACRPGVADDRLLDLVGPESLPYRSLVERAARVAGRSVDPRPSPVPVALLRWVLRLRTLVFGPGFSSDALDVIMDSHDVDPAPGASALGLELTTVDAMLQEMIDREKAT